MNAFLNGFLSVAQGPLAFISDEIHYEKPTALEDYIEDEPYVTVTLVPTQEAL